MSKHIKWGGDNPVKYTRTRRVPILEHKYTPKIHKCIYCGKEFEADRANHDICYKCFKEQL